MRTLIGLGVVILGLVMFTIGMIKHKQLWTGVKTVTIEKVAEVKEPAKDDGTVETGPLRIQIRYEWKTNNLPTGEYQVIDTDGKIWMMKFCSPAPDLEQSKVYDIKYLKSDKDCTPFVNAKLLPQ